MKLTLMSTRFIFHDETGKEYFVVCPPGTWKDNTFVVYSNGKKLGTYKPRGSHVNKTMALLVLKVVLSKANPHPQNSTT